MHHLGVISVQHGYEGVTSLEDRNAPNKWIFHTSNYGTFPKDLKESENICDVY